MTMWCRLRRFSIGFSVNGLMSSGSSSAVSNAVIGDFQTMTVKQYQFTGYTPADIVSDPTATLTGTSLFQSGNNSVMMFSRMANNGNPSDAQISLTGATWVMWAIGSDNAFSANSLPLSESRVPLVLLQGCMPNVFLRV